MKCEKFATNTQKTDSWEPAAARVICREKKLEEQPQTIAFDFFLRNQKKPKVGEKRKKGSDFSSGTIQ